MRLSKPQKLIYDMEKYAGGSISVICGSMLLPGKKEITEIRKAIHQLYQANAGLRVRNFLKQQQKKLNVFMEKSHNDRNINENNL